MKPLSTGSSSLRCRWLAFAFIIIAICSPRVWVTAASITSTHRSYNRSPQSSFSIPVLSRVQSRIASTLQSAWHGKSAASPSSTKSFKLKKAYHQGMSLYPGLTAVKSYQDDDDFALTLASELPPLKAVRQVVTRAKDPKAYLRVRGTSLEGAICASENALEWEDVEIEAPDTSDRQTLLALAKMASHAYNNDTSSWEPGYGGYNLSDSFGWTTDGIRGHIYGNEDNSTIVVAIKGTSPPVLPGGSDTAKRDKTNDNLLFSCCCARVSWSWSTVCDCYAGHGSTCDQTCLERALVEKSLYYPATTDLFNNISYMYPDSQVWITGHSLGGSLSSLLGMTFGVPTVTFEAPGEQLAAMRLHLPLPPSKDPEESPVSALPITHVYHNGDPLAMGTCNGAASLCSSVGYAMESRCHAGKSIVYDTVGKLGWSSSLNSHRINTVVEDLLDEDWDEKVRKHKGETPEPDPDQDPWLLSSPHGLMLNWFPNAWRWPWSGSRGSKDDPEEDHLLPVPKKRADHDCVDCTDWRFVDKDESTGDA
ncbi:alpha/beta-hydrolase [Violaceomyces palustris]|uniref:Alpha/beta-hydrolase n=1 Tax=Violaceomyces palustris TaxID=1673888 RepID=A0ACD0NX74_9BASI|nr:alpha/beta-hydrolase [Violaceomyces palustris]